MKDSVLIRIAFGVALLTILGRGLGFFRDMTIAGFWGASADTDAYLIAWAIPETAAPLLLEGAILFVLIPLFARAQKSHDTFREALEGSLSLIVGVTLALSLGSLLFAPLIVRALGPGLVDQSLAVQAVRLASPTVLLFGIAGFATAVLRTKEVFQVTAIVYVAYNIGIIVSIFGLRSRLGILSAALGLSIGAVLMVAVQIPSYVRRVGLPRPTLPISQWVRRDLIAFIPIAAFVVLRHAQVYVERFLGSTLETGTIARVNFAERVAQVPTSIVITIAVVSFPFIARSVTKGSGQMTQALHRDLGYVVAAIAPAIVFLLVSSDALIALLFERGAFNASDTAATGDLLRIYSIGLVGQVVVAVALLAFFSARSYLWHPPRAAAAGLGVTILADALLVQHFGAEALMIGNALGISVMALLLLRQIDSLVLALDWSRLRLVAAKAAAAAVTAGGLAVLIRGPLADLGAVMEVVTTAIIVTVTYATVARLIGLREVGEMLGALVRRQSP